MPAVLFGSISTIVDTSELQRDAFNRAFEVHGLSWRWELDEYRSLLSTNGGEQRIAGYGAGRGETVDAGAVHATKTEIFQQSLRAAPPAPRPGVLDTIRDAKAGGLKLGFVTTTAPENVAAVLSVLGPEVTPSDFDVITDAMTVGVPKPDGAVYAAALSQLGERAADCVAIEDNPGGVRAAGAAGIACIAFPNTNTAGLDFTTAASTTDRLDLDQIRSLFPNR